MSGGLSLVGPHNHTHGQHLMETERHQDHWQRTYLAKAEHEVSWSQDAPEPSLSLITSTAKSTLSRIIDIGGGASHLVDHLLLRGYSDISVLDVSSAALSKAQARLAERATSVDWIVSNIASWQPSAQYELWHDRATFHFMVTEADRSSYMARLREALAPGGHAVIATFDLNGPDTCSGLPVKRYDPAGLAGALGSGFILLSSQRHLHHTPWNAGQSFQFSVFRHQQ